MVPAAAAGTVVAVRYVPYDDLDGRPNVIVDGAATAGTVLTLSHWPHSHSPRALARDLSAEMAFAYLDTPEAHVTADLVSNNHLDEDGVVSVHALTDPAHALAHRDLLVEVARAGDFSTTSDRTAARLAFALSALIDGGAGYESLLARLPSLVADPGGARSLWAAADEALAESLARVAGGAVEVDEHPDVDLSVVRVASGGFLHPIALHDAVAGLCVLEVAGDGIRITQRYEGWVQYASRRPRARRDLRPLAERLGAADTVAWAADGPGSLVPTCTPAGAGALAWHEVRDALVEHLRTAPPAWVPYDD